MKIIFSKVLFCFAITMSPALVKAQFSFTDANSRLVNANYHSGCPTTVADWNQDGLDDIIKLNNGHDCWVEIQNSNGSFTPLHIYDFASGNSWAWGMCVGDVDHNGYLDIIAGASGAVYMVKTDIAGMMGGVITLPNSNIFLQNATFGDFNNDGWVDIFCCHDTGESRVWLNDGAGNFPTEAGNSVFNFDITTSDDSGNYGSIWSDFDNDDDVDFYIAKCRQVGTPSSDMRKHDVLFLNDGSYNYAADFADINNADQDSLLTDLYCPDHGTQTWTANFGDFDNDGDFDLVRTSYQTTSELLENDGTGHFTDITVASGFNIGTTFEIESQIEDFDNDGFQDIILTGTRDIMFRNNGNMTFTIFDDNVFPSQLGSFSSGDLNHDGNIDVYGSYNNIYTTPTSENDVVYLNDGNANHWLTFNLIGTVSNHNAIGAHVILYSALGKQIREVRSGESYGTVNGFNLHFGLGSTITSVDSAVIHYPSGIENTLYNVPADQFITNVETGGCTIQSGNISTTGSLTLCPGQSITLTGPAGFASYLWSDGSTNQTYTVTEAGDYSVLVSNGACNVYTPSIHIVSDAANAPVISTSDALSFCEGGSAILTSTSATSYTWSDGSTTQSITVSQSGVYHVNTPGTGVCPTLQSNDITVDVISVTAPVGTDDYITSGNTATLQATGTDVHWFDAASGGNELGTGNSFTTPVLTVTTDYFAEGQYSYGAINGVVGQPIHLGSDYSGSTGTNAKTYFDALQDFTLQTVKVYTDSADVRRITLTDNAGNIVDSLSVSVPMDSAVITLNFFVPAGTGYELSTDGAVNTANLGYTGPHLKRSSTGVTYPMDLAGLCSITGNDQNQGYFYYFYDWHIDHAPTVCKSNRTTVTANVSTGVSSFDGNTSVDVYPNPSDGLLNIETNFNYSQISVFDLMGKKVFAAGSWVNSIDLSILSKGSYMLQLTDVNNQTVRTQIVLE